MRLSQTVIAALLGSLGGLVFSEARAQTAPEFADPRRAGLDVLLDYRAPPVCPNSLGFAEQVTARSDRVHFSGEASDAQVRVGIGKATGEFVATLRVSSFTLDGRQHEGVQRSLRDASCEDLVVALAFITVVVLDPSALSSENGATQTAAPRREVPEPASPLPASTPEPTPWKPEVGLQALLTGAPAPKLMPGAGVYFESSPADGSWQVPRLSWSIRGALNAGMLRSTISSDALPEKDQLDTLWLAAQLDWCPFSLGGLSTCAGLEMGLLNASTTANPAPRPRYWAALQAALQLRVPVSKLWALQLRGGPSLPLTRDRIGVDLVDGDQARFIEVHTPQLSGFANLGFAVQLR